MVEIIVKEVTLHEDEIVEAVSLNRTGTLLGIRCRSEGLSDYSRFVRLIMYADNVCLIRRLLSDPRSIPALHMDHISGVDTLHWAVEAGVIRPPWLSPLGRRGVLQHDKRHSKWDYFAYNTPSTSISFIERFKILLHNPCDKRVKFRLKLLISNLECNQNHAPSLHILYYSYGIALSPGDTIHAGYIEGPGKISCFWIHVKVDEKLALKNRVFGAFCRISRLPFNLLLNLLDKIILEFSGREFLFKTSLGSLGIIDLTSIVNRLYEYYGLVLLPPYRVDLFIDMPLLILPSDDVKVVLKNLSQYRLKIWFNLWIEKVLR